MKLSLFRNRKKTVEAAATPVIAARTCKKCDRVFPTGTDGRRKLCDWCRKADPHRNGARAAKKPKMFVSIDGEGQQIGEEMHLMTLSVGREDGTSETHIVGEDGVRGALKWLIKTVAKLHHSPDGLAYKQVPVAFHFGWDSAVMTKDFDPKKMFLVRKVQTKVQTALCGYAHKEGEVCHLRHDDDELDLHLQSARAMVATTTDQDVDGDYAGLLHRYDPEDVEAVITEGGENDIIAYDPESNLAMSLSTKRRFYLEYRPNGDRFEGWRRVDVHDTGTAFMGGLLKVISDWNPELTEQQRAIIEWGKQRRTEVFDHSEIDKIVEYSEAECVAHARVCRILLDLLKETAHVPMAERDLYGSGSIAGATLKFYGAPSRKDSNTLFEDIAKMTYFGGMIETPVIGLVQGLVDEVDINSAYPHKMIDIPCMREGCGDWGTADQACRAVNTDSFGLPNELVGHGLVSWDVSDCETSTPPFIVRNKHMSVFQPLMGDQTWVSLAELKAGVQRFGTERIIIHKVIYWAPNCVCGKPKPFEFLGQLYDSRLGFKDQMKGVEKESTEWWNLSCKEKAIKLVINSVYGKMAQQRPKMGKYSNLHLASYITGATRAQVRAETWAREDQGGTVVYQHTDSVLSIGGSPKDGGKKLGAWGMEKQSKDFLIAQPGLAIALGGGKKASRGCKLDAFEKAAIEWAEKTDLTTHPTTWGSMITEQRVMITRKQAIARGKPHLAGSFVDKITEIGLISHKRNMTDAVPLDGVPTAWVVPPIVVVMEPATLADIKLYRSQLEQRLKAGEFEPIGKGL